VSGISFGIEPGESLALIGKNGAGKSTLLKLITGVTQPTTGTISVRGRTSAILELGLGFSAELTGRQNIMQAGGMMGFSPSELSKLMPDIEAFAEIGSFMDKPLRVYSSGMQARLAFSLATATRPDVLIVDEVLSVGDVYFQAKCFDRIASFKEQGTTLLLVTHSISDVVRHADKALFMRDGEAAFFGEPRVACNLYLESVFGSSRLSQPPQSPLQLSDRNDVFHTRPNYRKEENRWGDGGARIVDYLVRSEGRDFPPSVRSNSLLELSFSVVFDADFEDVTPGMLLKGLDGLFVYGTNSFLLTQGQGPVSVKAGDRRVFTFTLPADLNAGHYLLSFGVSTGPQEHLVPLDRRYDAVILPIERPSGFWGVFDLRATFGVA
jgi:lipopolysaccharide transport system ATP-binding protein